MSRKKSTKKRKRSANQAGRLPEGDWAFRPAYLAPTALDVVWCRFPLVEDPKSPGPKERPALVRRVLLADGGTYLEVVFGTSNPRSYSERDLYVANVSDMVDAGLPQATVFQLGKTAVIPWAEEWCAKRADSTGPVVGHLNQRCREYLKHLLSRK